MNGRPLHNQKISAVICRELAEAVLVARTRFSTSTPLTSPPKNVQKALKREIQQLAALVSTNFAESMLIPLTEHYQLMRHAQSSRNMADTKISSEQIRRQLRKLITAGKKPEEAAFTLLLNDLSPQAKHYIAVCLKLPDIQIGTYWEGLFDGIETAQLVGTAEQALRHPHLQAGQRGRSPDNAGNALIWSFYQAFSLYTGQQPKIWSDGHSESSFLKALLLLFSIVSDTKTSSAHLRDRARAVIKSPPKPPYSGILFSKPAC